MFKFKCNGGRHFEDGKCIMAGDVFESNKELHKAFPDRFELIQELVSKDVQNVVQGSESEIKTVSDNTQKTIEAQREMNDAIRKLYEENKPITMIEEPKKQTVQRGRPRK